MAEEVKHINVEQKYRVIFERSAVKGQDGFKIETNGDDFNQVQEQAEALYSYAREVTELKIEVKSWQVKIPK